MNDGPAFNLAKFMGRAEWTEHAACRGMDPDTFFPEPKRGARRRAAVTEALATCRRCDVQAECLAFAMNAGEFEYGIWGGLDAADRRRLANRRQLNSAARGMPLRHLAETT